jgi:hypothetical protein
MVDKRAIQEMLRNSLASQDPMGVAKAVSLPPIQPVARGAPPQPTSRQQSLIIEDVNYGGLLVSLWDAHAAAETGHPGECYEAQASVHSNLNRLLSSSEGNWLIPALIVACQNTHKTALAADRADAKTGSSSHNSAKLQSAVQILQDSYSKTFNDRTEYQVCILCERTRHLSSTCRCDKLVDYAGL